MVPYLIQLGMRQGHLSFCSLLNQNASNVSTVLGATLQMCAVSCVDFSSYTIGNSFHREAVQDKKNDRGL